jgi:hypothetical protein
MALRQKTLGYRGRRHAAPGTAIHKEDKAIAEQRKAVAWVPLAAAIDDKEQDVTPPHPLGIGSQYKVVNGKLIPSSTGEYVAHLDDIYAERDWYKGTMQRGGKETTVRRKRPDVIEQIAVTLPPCVTEFLRVTAEMESGKFRPQVKQCYGEMGETIVQKYNEITGREAIGLSEHFDTAIDHYHLQGTRVDEHNQLIGKHRGLRTGGGWMAGVKRQIDAGGVPEDSEKFRVFHRNMDAFRKRNNGELPLEIALNNAVDEVFDKMFGKSEFAKRCRENYAMEVMHKENYSMEIKAEKLEEKALAIRQEIALRESEMTPCNPVVSPSQPVSQNPPNLPGLS